MAFQSTLPIQGETGIVHNPNRLEKFQSTLPIQGETHRIIAYCYSRIFQSTLPIQGETLVCIVESMPTDISIHSPYTGRDLEVMHGEECWENFNPLSLYRERPSRPPPPISPVYFNPLSLYRERLIVSVITQVIKDFNPLSLYRERLDLERYKKGLAAFQSTLPIQGETRNARRLRKARGISIHSPYTGRDLVEILVLDLNLISIHSPYTGRDGFSGQYHHTGDYFNPLSLYRERP